MRTVTVTRWYGHGTDDMCELCTATPEFALHIESVVDGFLVSHAIVPACSAHLANITSYAVSRRRLNECD